MTSYHNSSEEIGLKNSPLISVVLATYNGERFLEQQLDSLLSQTYEPLEVIAVDDASSDQTMEILERYAAANPMLTVYRNERNLGFIKTFDKACSLASGSFLAPCDQDDYWDPGKIEKLYKHIGNYPMIYSDSYVVDENLNIKKKISDKVNSIDFNLCLQQCIYCRIYGHATLITKALYEKATPFILDIPHDWWLCYLATLHGGIKYYNEPLVYYRQHDWNAIGVVGEKKRRHHKKDIDAKQKTRHRVVAFYEACPVELHREKEILSQLTIAYQDFSFLNNFKRAFLFFRYNRYFLAPKKKSTFMRFLFCFKMFVKIK